MEGGQEMKEAVTGEKFHQRNFFEVFSPFFLSHQFVIDACSRFGTSSVCLLGRCLKQIRASLLIGGLVPLLALLVWDAIAFGLSSQVDQVADPLELLLRVKWSGGVSYMVQAFSLLAVGTSLIGTLLSFSEFLKEQLNNLDLQPDVSTRLDLQQRSSNSQLCLTKWWRRNNLGFTATAIAIAPPLVSTTTPDAFSAATDIAGGYCMTMLYGILPPAMAWAMHNSESRNSEKIISRARPALLSLGLVACGIVAVQILQDLSLLHS
ncbi:hypothetical protein RND71_025029 [Anisodus tanguticus]|uniref:Uncharacterized protein n=1 Tax=Anisodus tanguticus TaxID=243964 RepID=A0AAE1RSA4_9SOLA|nr:hypothetical protein RND71_025029 [Anisodus tanguticus]